MTGEIVISVPGVTINFSITPCDCSAQLAQIIERLNHMTTQADIDAIVSRLDANNVALSAGFTALTDAVAGIRQDVADIKAANPALDLSALDNSLAALDAQVASIGTAVADATELDSENPAPPAP